MRVLLVEDSIRLAAAITTGFRKAGHVVDHAAEGMPGLRLATAGEEYDVLILDIMLPDLDGLTLLDRLRTQGRQTHVLLLTARDTVEDRVHGLRAGADDYLIKPFAFEELLARAEALARRRHNKKDPRITIGGTVDAMEAPAALLINTAARTVTRVRDGSRVELSPREYTLLEYLALRAGTVVSRTEIETNLYDSDAEPMSNVVDAAVYSLRKRIDEPGRPSLIHTRRGMGYTIEESDADAHVPTRTPPGDVGAT